MKLLVISCSLSDSSRSARMAEELVAAQLKLGDEVQLLDLRSTPLPLCNGGSGSPDANTAKVTAMIDRADAVVMAVPIYNFDVGGAARNLIAVTGRNWQDKVVGMIAAAGGQRSYMSLMPLANSLMLDYRCVIVPRFVYASASSFDGAELVGAEVQQRIEGLAQDLHRFAGALA